MHIVCCDIKTKWQSYLGPQRGLSVIARNKMTKDKCVDMEKNVTERILNISTNLDIQVCGGYLILPFFMFSSHDDAI